MYDTVHLRSHTRRFSVAGLPSMMLCHLIKDALSAGRFSGRAFCVFFCLAFGFLGTSMSRKSCTPSKRESDDGQISRTLESGLRRGRQDRKAPKEIEAVIAKERGPTQSGNEAGISPPRNGISSEIPGMKDTKWRSPKSKERST